MAPIATSWPMAVVLGGCQALVQVRHVSLCVSHSLSHRLPLRVSTVPPSPSISPSITSCLPLCPPLSPPPPPSPPLPHRLQVGDKICGDPIETESVKALGWAYNARIGTCSPGPTAAACIDKGASCKILFRYHFSSKLQRMATLTRVVGQGASGTWILVKGSPEAVGKLLAKQVRPRTPMTKVANPTSGISGGRSLTGPSRDARRFASSRL
jgi:hypothetical protein